MTIRRLVPLVLGSVLLIVATAHADSARGPEDTVRGYLSAMQEHRFADAYDFVSSTLRAGKSREEWAKEQKYIVNDEYAIDKLQQWRIDQQTLVEGADRKEYFPES